MGPYESGLREHYREVIQRRYSPPALKVQPEEVALVPVNNGVSHETPTNAAPVITEEPIKPRQTIRGIVAVVARRYQVTEQDMASACREKKMVIPRHIICYLARKLTLQSMPQIGRVLGDRDHTSILSAIRKITRMRDEDEHFAAHLEDIERELTGTFA